MSIRLYMAQVNNRYGINVYIPLSVGMLWSYARTFPEIADTYEMCDFLYVKEAIATALSRLDSPDIVAISDYIWSAEWNKAFARAVKDKWPECFVIVGGVNVHDESPRTLAEHLYYDAAIYGEGEGSFKDFLIEHAKEKPDYATVGSLVWRDGENIVVNARRPFVDLKEIPSPYLEGVFACILDREPRWQALQESHRGCPYFCSFCAWSAASLTKIRPFPDDRILAEFDWFGRNKVDYLDNADANYALLKRDVAMTEALVETKAKYGYPKTFRTSFAKNSNETVWTIANILHGAGMLKSVTLAMQSMDQGVLQNIHRKNIKFDHFGELVKKYEAAGIPTYTELIMGLPGETLESYIAGVDANLDAQQHSGLFCYMNLRLPNTEQDKPEYVKKYGLRSVSMQAMLTHGSPQKDVVVERQEIIVETAAMPHADWKRAWLFSKVVEIFHAQGLLQQVAIHCREADSVPYSTFYKSLMGWLDNRRFTTLAGLEYAGLKDLLDRALAGGSWDCVDPRLGDISWPPEEFAFARICCDLPRFYSEIRSFLELWNVPVAVEAGQRKAIVGPEPGQEAEWGRRVAWYGRKGAAAKLRKEGVKA